MRNKWYFFLLIIVMTVCEVYAQRAPSGVPVDILNQKAKEYLERIFNQYLYNRNLIVYDISSSPNLDETSTNADFYIFQIEGRFRNFAFNSRTGIFGRLRTQIKIRKNDKDYRIVEDVPKRKIELYFGDLLASELRDSTVIDYIRNNYSAMDISINNERLEIYPDDIYSYVTAVIDRQKINYFRVVFQREAPNPSEHDAFTMYETRWQLKRAEPIFESPIPNSDVITKDTDLLHKLFGIMSKIYNDNNSRSNLKEGGSKINSISKVEVVDSTNGKIKLEINLSYNLDRSGFFGSYEKYDIQAYTYYQYNTQDNIWNFIDIELIGQPKAVR